MGHQCTDRELACKRGGVLLMGVGVHPREAWFDGIKMRPRSGEFFADWFAVARVSPRTLASTRSSPR